MRIYQYPGLSWNIPLQLSITVWSVMFNIDVCIIFTVTATQTKFCAGQVVSSAGTPLGCALSFALTPDQLKNGQRCGWNLCVPEWV